MKKFLLFGIVLLVLAGMVYSVEQFTLASVDVNTFVSITLSDPVGSAEVDFSALNPGVNNNPDLEQTGVAGAIKVTNDAVSNTNIKVDVKGTNFNSVSTGASIAVGQVTYDDDNTPSQGVETAKAETTLATTYPGVAYYTGVTPSSAVDFWFFLDVPSGQTAATDYSSTFTFQGIA